MSARPQLHGALRVYPETVLELVAKHDDDAAILGDLRALGIPSAEETWFDARATEDELETDVYLRVRPRGRIDEIEQRAGDVVLAIDDGEALISLGERQKRIVRAGEIVRIPPELPHTIASVGPTPLQATRLELTSR